MYVGFGKMGSLLDVSESISIIGGAGLMFAGATAYNDIWVSRCYPHDDGN